VTVGSAIITGASRGIGEALAAALAEPGRALLLVGRDEERLRAVAAACEARGATAEVATVDVRDRAATEACLRDFDARHPVELVVANAGIALPSDDGPLAGTSYDEIAVNLVGALNTVLPLVEPMSARGRGRIAFVSSLAAFTPMAESPGYSGSKAGLLLYGLALRQRLRPHGIAVHVVCPGYIDTAMGDLFGSRRPFLLTSEEAARRILRGFERNRAVIAFPRRLAVFARLSTLVPEPVMRLGMAVFGFREEKPRA
jgi:short-subunit dehydrogenase